MNGSVKALLVVNVYDNTFHSSLWGRVAMIGGYFVGR